MDAIKVPTSFFIQSPKSKTVQNEKSCGKDWKMSGLVISGK